jgi:hypothetical protein
MGTGTIFSFSMMAPTVSANIPLPPPGEAKQTNSIGLVGAKDAAPEMAGASDKTDTARIDRMMNRMLRTLTFMMTSFWMSELGLLVSRLKALAHRDSDSSVTFRVATAMIAYNHKTIMSN